MVVAAPPTDKATGFHLAALICLLLCIACIGHTKVRQIFVALILPVENTEPGHWELFIPDDAKWRATVPDWAKDRHQEIALRIGQAWKPKDFHLPNGLKGPDASG